MLYNSLAQKIKQQLEDGQFVDATNSWSELESVISSSSNNVVVFSFLDYLFLLLRFTPYSLKCLRTLFG